MPVLEEIETIIKESHQNELSHRIHQAILAIDAELSVATDRQYRERLVKAAYPLRSLEEVFLKMTG